VSGLDEVGAGYADLRWHPALRRRAAEVHAEVLVRAAAASAAVEGARVPVDVLRRTDVTAPDAGRDPALAVAVSALRAMVAVDRAAQTLIRAPSQVLARVHAAAAAGRLPPDALGRPRPGSHPALAGVRDLLGGGRGGAGPGRPGGHGPGTSSDLPAVDLAGEVHALVLTADVVPPVSGIAARAMARGVLRVTGLDPLGVGVPERACAVDLVGYRSALRGYRAGDPEGRAGWREWWRSAVLAGAAEGRDAADRVARGG
jgi:hypothetical protein